MSAPVLPTRVAHAGFDDHRWFGHAVAGELVGGESLLGMMMLAVSGRRPTSEERAVLDELSVAITVADPRIWPLKIARVLASYGGIMAGFGGAQLAIECDGIGPWVTAAAAETLVELRALAGDLASDESFAARAREVLARRPILCGFGVPFRPADERYVTVRARLQQRGRTELPFWRVQERLSRVVRAERKAEPNIAIATAALLLDMGLSPAQARNLTIFAMEHMFFAHAIEGAEQSAPELQALPVERVTYTGPHARRSPRAARAVADDPQGKDADA